MSGNEVAGVGWSGGRRPAWRVMGMRMGVGVGVGVVVGVVVVVVVVVGVSLGVCVCVCVCACVGVGGVCICVRVCACVCDVCRVCAQRAAARCSVAVQCDVQCDPVRFTVACRTGDRVV